MSATTRNQVFTAVHTVGGLLPADMLVRISEGKDVPGSKPADYGLPSSRSVRDEAERSWEYLKPLWRELRKRLPEDRETGVPASDPTGLAENDWLTPLWRELGFGRLTHIGAAGITADSDAEKKFPVSHRWHHALIHQAAWNAELDKRPGGAGTVPPQSMFQECLNRTEAHLWGVLTNGRQVRLLRDSSALATASYVEFDLEAIFDGELFSEFVLLYRLLHASRFEVAEGAAPSSCWLEKWRTEAIASGTRALDQLRKGVQQAITALGTGFLRHPENTALREDVRPKALQAALLRMVYRLLFVFVAEDRDALLSPGADDIARERYETYFSSARLRAHARKRRGTAHGDLYEALRIVLAALGDEKGRPELGLPGLGGLFNDTEADAPLRDLKLSNEVLLTAVRHLSQVRDSSSGRWRAVDYRHLDAEELGSVYESLLELEPKYSAAERTFTLVEIAGNTRKTTGSYYTPSSLIECLLNTTLDPVIRDAVQRGEEAAARSGAADPADAIINELLSLTVCDPACGSGHFLVAAARRIAKRVAAVRERNPEPTLDAVRHALHEVVARCIYGVDLNPMAVDLAKVSLWLEALEPGKPLSFLDAHVKHGNALIGTTPALLQDGIPSTAFRAVEGDNKKFAKSMEKQNDLERGGQHGLFDLTQETKVTNTVFAASLHRIVTAPSDTLTEVNRQESAYREWSQTADYIHALHVADAWCATFLWYKTPDAPPLLTEDAFRALQDPTASAAPKTTHEEIVRLRDEHHFFHWHLEFPEVFRVTADEQDPNRNPSTGWSGGFSCITGNPPWENIEFKEKEFFAGLSEDIPKAAGAKRKALIANLETKDPEIYSEYKNALRNAKSIPHFVSNSGLFPLYTRGMREVKGANRYKLDALFVEKIGGLTADRGRMGLLTPTGIATDAVTQFLFKNLVESGSLVAIYDFENRGGLFPAVDSRMKFSILSTVGRSLSESAARFAFFLQDPSDLADPDKVFFLTPEEINLLNPNTGTCPVFRSRVDAEVTLGMYRRAPILIAHQEQQRNSWDVKFTQGLFNMTDDSALFRVHDDLVADGWTLEGNVFVRGPERMLPLYEGRMGHQYNHRFADSKGDRESSEAQLSSSKFVVQPQYWVSSQETNERQQRRNFACTTGMLGHRRVARNNDERTSIAAIIPWGAASYGWILSAGPTAVHLALLVAAFNSFAYDYALRNSFNQPSIPLSTSEQIPVPMPGVLGKHGDFIIPRVLELTYSANDMQPFATDLGDNGAPFRWNEIRRTSIRIELDALFFHLYGISREDVDYILDTFPIVRRKDEAKYGTYRTKELILAEYDRMAAAGLTLENPLVDGENYTSTLTPPPGQGPRHPA
ncbi:Eco57I restriction-modification methylase domain-containing protein [Streptomyces griseorubiginosus]|uniref:Eco57I restriction-modification methylase domain-containing protein n=1 Tax=Streptomyces griseorubiginosus TaxID=67304 RepID=UPI002E8201F7|nr:DNA methyltransferase [Streptomyces griseorubiginosus]WUB47522.1 N-6 DNA methylase [Streptomyces griseorubiginosus]WUB56047.1 N-6 DNA methylase [Streptomyces griseorubiginosus]